MDVITKLVLTVKLAVFAPAGTVTLAGIRAAPVLLLERDTTAPPDGAGTPRVTVPVEDCVPPLTLVGLSASVDCVSGGGVVEPDGARSNSHTVGFGSLSDTRTNFEADTTYATTTSPVGVVKFTGALPFTGQELTA